MSLQGPVVVVAKESAPELMAALSVAGASPIIEASDGELGSAIDTVEPAAVVLADPQSPADPQVIAVLSQVIAGAKAYVPVIACIGHEAVPPLPVAIPVFLAAATDWLVARLRAALRVRTLHISVLQRIEGLRSQGVDVPPLPLNDPIEDATVIVAGRGGSYPALTVAIGERVGLIGALSLETARGFIRARDVDGIVIGDGFNRRVVADFLAEIATDPQLRDMPVAVVDDVGGEIDPERLPNLERVAANPVLIADQVLPMVRLHAFSARLRRMALTLDAKGMIDPNTGLRTDDAFRDDLIRAVDEAERRGVGLSLARFSLENLADRRISIDAARIVARLVRAADFACRDADGTILVAFAATDLRTVHVVARRIASVLKHTTLAPGRDRNALDPTVTIAAWRSRDTAETLIARVARENMVAAS